MLGQAASTITAARRDKQGSIVQRIPIVLSAQEEVARAPAR
jgi:hypothetical protein